MKAVKPFVTIPEDSHNRIMARSGQIVGFTKTRIVWQYGFMPDSDMAKAYGVSMPEFLWILATYNGKILAEFKGYALELPERFKNVISANL